MLSDKINSGSNMASTGLGEMKGKSIGEFSKEEWEKLLGKVDNAIEEYRQDLEERKEEALEKQKEKAELNILSRDKNEELVYEQNVMQGGALRSMRFQRINEGMFSAGQEEVEKPDVEDSFHDFISDEAIQRIVGQRKQIPYSVLADENGIIEYKGVVFVGDESSNSLCLGDMTDYGNILTVPLTGGGYLKVNMDNVEDLSKAITMFSPQDINRIMRAIAQYNRIKQIQQQIDDETSGLEVLKKNDEIGFYA